MKHLITATALVLGFAWGTSTMARNAHAQSGAAHTDHEPQSTASGMAGGAGHEHGAPALAITYAELKDATQQLDVARQATAKYQDVRAAVADGYHAIGPNVPGMGIHYVRQGSPKTFSIGEPPILLYEHDPATGLRLVGVSYLLVAPSGADGQPATSPFPKALASWHKHNNVCVLPDSSASVQLTEAQCTGRGGRFSTETSWMVHAWIWKDSPAGVFSSTNPSVK